MDFTGDDTIREYKLGRFAGLDLSIKPSGFVGAILLWIALGAIAAGLLHFSPAAAAVMGFIAMLLHWLGETLHQLGHAASASRTGYPMQGIQYWGVLSSSIYPQDEPTLAGPIHIRRALDGPAASFLVAVLSGLFLILLIALSASDAVRWLAIFFLADNLLVFCLGALLPLGFTDGSTLLQWRGKP